MAASTVYVFISSLDFASQKFVFLFKLVQAVTNT